MDKNSLVASLSRYIGEQILDGDAEDLSPTTPLLELGVLDSFSTIQLLSHIESELEIQIPLESLNPDNIACIDAIAELIIRTATDTG